MPFRCRPFTGDVDLITDSAAPGLHRDCQFDCFFIFWMHWRQFFHLQNVHPEIADFVQTQPGELRHCFGDPTKNFVYRQDRIATADGCEQIP